jgi:hypothetical protein
MPTNPAAEADALAVAVLTGAELAGAELAGAVAAAALLAGAAADGLPLPGGEVLQPAAKPIRPANTAARTAAAPMVLSFLFMAFLSIWFSVAWCHELFTRASGASSSASTEHLPPSKTGSGDPHLFPCCGITPTVGLRGGRAKARRLESGGQIQFLVAVGMTSSAVGGHHEPVLVVAAVDPGQPNTVIQGCRI